MIWIDETSVVLGHRRGKRRIWRTRFERYNSFCVRFRWKSALVFMFWGSFTYHKKGSCHVWTSETAKEELDRLNAELELEVKRKWELETVMKRLNIRRKPGGKQPVWKFTKARGALVRDIKGGIDWYRYQKIILEGRLLSFAQKLKYEDGIDVLVQEDKVLAHASAYQEKIFMNWSIMRFLWLGNFSDLNVIEPVQPWMKRHTTKKGFSEDRVTAEKVWKRVWK